jgi:raffinose/stachyose/melibiose transport system substrate-binding protein
MIRIQRITACLLLCLLFLSFGGCEKNEKAYPKKSSLKITIGQNYRNFEKALKTEFPDINFEFECYLGPNTTEYLRLQLQHDDMGDIFLGTLQYDDETCQEHLLDLSGYGFMENYESSILNQYDVDGAIYLVPGSIKVRTMAYNKTLFAEKGWQAPTNHGELVALVKQIRRESDLTPIAFGGKGLGYYFTTMTTYAQTDYLVNAQGREWEKNYLAGGVSCKEGFQGGIHMLQQLIDADAYDIELDGNHWDSGAMDRLIRREAAMITIWGGQSEFVHKMAESTDEFVLLPFYDETGEPFLGTNICTNIGLAKHLEKAENQEKLESALRVMEWLTTAEGMSTLNTGIADILPLKSKGNIVTAKVYRDIWEANLRGIKAPMLYAGYEDIMIQTSEIIRDAMMNGKSLDGLTDVIDKLHRQALDTPKKASLGAITERFTNEETVQLITNVLYESGLADIALVSMGGCINDVVNKWGVNGKLYEGDLYVSNITVYMPGNATNAPLEVLTLTGEQIRDLLENGKRLSSTENTDKTTPASAVFDYYWAGINAEIQDGKVKTMKLADGTDITADGLYTVIFAQGDYTDDLAKSGNPVTQNIGCQDLFKAYLAANSPIAPPEPQ